MIIFISLMIANILGLMLILNLSHMKCHHELRGSAVNPYVFFCFLSIFFNLDFYFLWDKKGVLDLNYEVGVSLTETDVLYGYIVYTVMFLSVCAAFLVAQLSWKNKIEAERLRLTIFGRPSSIAHLYSSRVIMVVSLCIGIFAYYTMGAFAENAFRGMARQVLFREHRWLIIIFLFIPPALIIFLAHHVKKKIISSIAVIICLVILYQTGTRGHVIYVGVITAVILQLNGQHIRKIWLIVGIPFVTLFLLFERYYRRSQGESSSFGEFIDKGDGVAALFFNSGEISMAEVISTIVKKLDSFDRYPFESFVGLIMYPLPRSLISFKPYGSGAAFTNYVSPLRRDATGSEIATTGYGDILMQFGIIPSAFIIFILAYLWSMMCFRVISKGRFACMIWMPVLIWSMYIFIRSGIFDVGGKLWFFLFVLFFYFALAWIFKLIAGAATNREVNRVL